MKWFDGCKIRQISFVFVLALGLASASLAVEGTWTTKANMPTPRWTLSTCTVNGKIYAIGGVTSEPDSEAISTVEVYDPETDTWTKKSDMPTARWNFSASVVNGKIYAIGGLASVSGPLVSAVEEYDPVTDGWVKKTDMPTPKWGLSTSVVDGQIYVIGGAVSHQQEWHMLRFLIRGEVQAVSWE